MSQETYKIEDLLFLVRDQLNDIVSSSYDYYKNFDIVLENEHIYVDPKDRRKPNKIYMVLKILPATIAWGQNIIPITLTAVSESNKIECCQKLLTEYAQKFNFEKGRYPDKYLYFNQQYKSPSAMSSFNEVYTGYRSVFILSGSITLSYDTVQTEMVYYNHYNLYGEETGYTKKNTNNVEVLKIMTRGDSTSISLDSQPYSSTHNFTESSPKFATNSLTFTLYLTNNDFCKKLLKIKHKKISLMENYFAFGTKYSMANEDNDLKETFIDLYRLQNIVIHENTGDLPTVTVTFTF